jgi:hypothetical protein
MTPVARARATNKILSRRDRCMIDAAKSWAYTSFKVGRISSSSSTPPGCCSGYEIHGGRRRRSRPSILTTSGDNQPPIHRLDRTVSLSPYRALSIHVLSAAEREPNGCFNDLPDRRPWIQLPAGWQHVQWERRDEKAVDKGRRRSPRSQHRNSFYVASRRSIRLCLVAIRWRHKRICSRQQWHRSHRAQNRNDADGGRVRTPSRRRRTRWRELHAGSACCTVLDCPRF